MKAFVLSRTPGCEQSDLPVVDWEDICHGQRGRRFVFIRHEPFRQVSRHTHADRKRPFILTTRDWSEVSSHKTLAAAVRAAKAYATPSTNGA